MIIPLRSAKFPSLEAANRLKLLSYTMRENFDFIDEEVGGVAQHLTGEGYQDRAQH